MLMLPALLTLLACAGSDKDPGSDTSGGGPDAGATDGGASDGGTADGGTGDGGTADGGTGDGGDTGEPGGPSVVLSGTISCTACTGAVELLVGGVTPGSATVQRSVGVGDFSVEVPQALGDAVLVAWGDDDGDGLQDAAEPVGSTVATVGLAAGDVDGVALIVSESRFDPEADWWGVQLETGFWVLPGSVDILVTPDTTEDQVEALADSVGAELIDFIDEVDRAWLSLDTTDLDDDAALAQLETAEETLLADGQVLQVDVDVPVPGLLRTRTRVDDDYLSQPSDRQVAHLAARVDQAHDIYDDCVHHFDSADYTRTVRVGLVDGDLDALASTTELPHYWEPFRQAVIAEDRLEAGTKDSYHGTAVGSILAGKVNGVSHNGLLRGFDGTWQDNSGKRHAYEVQPQLYPWNVAYAGNGSAARAVYGLYKAVTYDHAQVVNASMGHGVAGMSGEAWIKHMGKLRQAFEFDPTAIFVLAAPNVDVDIDAEADWTSFGHIYSNVLSVSGVDGTDECACGRSGSLGNIAISAEYDVGYWLRALRFNGGTSVTLLGTASNNGTGTSYVAPQISAAAGLALAFDPTATGTDIQTRLRETGNDNDGASSRSGKTLDFARFTVSLLADELGDDTEYLLKLEHQPAGTNGGCGLSVVLTNHKCIPTQEDLSQVPGIDDSLGESYTFSGTRLVPTEGGDFDLVVTGPGLAPLTFTDHETTYDGTVSLPDSFAQGDLSVTGRYSGTANSGLCVYSGDFTGVLMRRSPD